MDNMQLGVHLPQAGTQAAPDRILRHAMRAEALGLADIWVCEHSIVPRDAPYWPTPIFYDPVVVLSWGASVTRRVRLATSVMVLRMRHPLPMAQERGILRELAAERSMLGGGHVPVDPNDREVDDRDRIPEGVGRMARG
jgi:alkanesulfonate monooxygenase SsuD/methylene tetrahydromethanopterin reductase-like flavin-dependent oxidoreductase (luciferase family)